MAPDSSQFKETETQYNLIGNILKDRSAQINQYTQSVNDAEKIINSADFLDKESEFVDLHANVMSIKDDNGNQKYESVMEWVSQEYARIESIGMNLLEGKKLGLKRGQGIDDSNIMTQIGAYQKRLNVALEALIGDNTITPEEANLIIMGDRNTFKQTRDRKVNEAKFGIKQYDSLIEGLRKGSDKSELTKLLFSAGLNDNQVSDAVNKAEGDGYFNADLDEISAIEKLYIYERNNLIDTYKSWSGTDYIGQFKIADEINAEGLKNAADGVTVKTSLLNVDDTDKDKDGIPDTIDVDAGTGTDKTVITPEAKKSFYDKETIDGHNLSDVKQKKFSLVPSKDYSRAGKREIKNVENRLKEKKEILDGTDKASSAMNKYLMGELNQNQALSEAAFSGKKSRTEVVGKNNRKKLRQFQIKFKNSNLSIEEFIAQNQKEYFELTRILKYGKYWKKVNKSVLDKHYINLYD
jgi:hypothetical protein